MKNILTIAKYELKRLFRDRRLVLIVLSQPIVIALIVGVIAHQEPKGVKVIVNNVQQNSFSEAFIDELESKSSLSITESESFSDEDIAMKRARVIVRVDITDGEQKLGKIEVRSDPAGSMATIVAEKAISDAARQIALTMAKHNIESITREQQAELTSQLSPGVVAETLDLRINDRDYDPLSVSRVDATPKSVKYFDYYGSSMMVVLVMLVILNLSGIAITGERVSGTFERMSVTPFRKKDIILGKAIALFLIGLAVNVIGILSLKTIYGVSLGNIWLIALMAVLVVGMSVGLGLFVSSVTKTVVESVELAMYVFFVSFLASGILLPIESSHKIFAWIENVLPFYHAVDASRRINMLGAGWPEIANDVYFVAAYTVLFLILATVALRRKAN